MVFLAGQGDFAWVGFSKFFEDSLHACYEFAMVHAITSEDSSRVLWLGFVTVTRISKSAGSAGVMISFSILTLLGAWHEAHAMVPSQILRNCFFSLISFVSVVPLPILQA